MITHDMFGDEEAQRAVKLIDLYEGRQLAYVKAGLDGNRDGYGKRANWLRRGFVPHMRNIVKPIVEKSAMLFNKPAKYEILPDNNPTAKPVVDAKFNAILMECDWQEFSRNLDIYTRLLKAAVVLQQKHIEGDDRMTVDGQYLFDPSKGDAMVPVLLHRGNSVVVMNKPRTKITELAYLTKGNPTDELWEYTYINAQVVQVVTIKAGKEVERTTMTNEDMTVPASIFYDTGKPRAGVWPKVPEDLPSFQDMYNTHLTDLAFALATGKSQTLVISNGRIVKGNEAPELRAGTVKETTDTLPGTQFRVGPLTDLDEAPQGGIGSVLNLQSGKNATTAPSADYKGPDVDLTGHDEVMRMLIQDLAADWSVKLKVAGGGGADSGFKLMVEEIDNLQLREQRAQSFQASLRRMYEVTCALYPELTAGSLQVIFAEPSLPVNQAEQIDAFTKKIAAGFASPIDWFMKMEGLSEPEAIKRAAEVKAFNEAMAPAHAPVVVDPNAPVDPENPPTVPDPAKPGVEDKKPVAGRP